MMRRRAAATAVACVSALCVAAYSQAANWRTFHANTQGFAISLPESWAAVSTFDQATLNKLSQEAGFASIASVSSTDSGVTVFASDKTAFMDAGAYRTNLTSLTAVLNDAVKSFRASKSTSDVTATTVVLPAGTAGVVTYRLGSGTGQTKANEFMFFRDGVVHVLNYAVPVARWGTYAATFKASAQTFEYEKGQDVSGLVLSARDLGKGFVRESFPAGASVIGATTLDLCNQTFPSEALRTSRLQVRFRYGKDYPVSNEVVAYASGGAAQALTEVKSAATACSATTITQIQGSSRVSFHTSSLNVAGLPAGAVAMTLHVTLLRAGKTLTQDGVAVYLVRGNVLSGIYAYASKELPLGKLTQIVVHAAERSAQKLGGVTLAA